MSRVCGIDEAGRGPVLGPLVMAIVACTEKDIDFLKKIGVKDSKLLNPYKRKKLAKIIKARCPHTIIKVSPKQIDASLNNENSSLNILEAEISGKLINRIAKKTEISKIIVDLPSKNKESYVTTIRDKLIFPTNALPIIAEYKADLNYIQVSAASILAKVARDAAMKSYEKRLELVLGSGYPADPNTIKAFNDYFEILVKEKLVRLSWKTTKNLIQKREQTTLSKFS